MVVVSFRVLKSGTLCSHPQIFSSFHLSANSFGSVFQIDPESTTSHALYHHHLVQANTIFCLYSCNNLPPGVPASLLPLWPLTTQNAPSKRSWILSDQNIPLPPPSTQSKSQGVSPWLTQTLTFYHFVLAHSAPVTLISSALPETCQAHPPHLGVSVLVPSVWNVLTIDCYMVMQISAHLPPQRSRFQSIHSKQKCHQRPSRPPPPAALGSPVARTVLGIE